MCKGLSKEFPGADYQTFSSELGENTAGGPRKKLILEGERGLGAVSFWVPSTGAGSLTFLFI